MVVHGLTITLVNDSSDGNPGEDASHPYYRYITVLLERTPTNTNSSSYLIDSRAQDYVYYNQSTDFFLRFFIEEATFGLHCGPYNVVNGTVSLPNSDTVGSTGTCNCDIGYVLSSTTPTTCELSPSGSSASWVNIPTCNAIHCGSLSVVNSSISLSNSDIVGSQATITCSYGYILSNSSSATCSLSGTGGTKGKWINVPTCYVCDQACVNGVCLNTGTGTNCVCNQGWTGSLCGSPVDSSAPSNAMRIVVITVSTIGGVALVAGLVIWWIRRQKRRGEMHEQLLMTDTSSSS